MRPSPKQVFTVFFILFLMTEPIYSQTTLATGDVAFTAMNTDGNSNATPFDYFSIVALVAIDAGTQIRFSDVQYLDASGFASSNGVSDFEFVWTAPAGGIAYLEQVTFWATGTTTPYTPHSDKGTVSGDGLPLSSGGDQIFAVQGSSMNSGTILAGIHSNYSISVTTGPSNWDDGTASSGESELPNSLTNGVNAIWVYDTGPSEVDNAIFNECGSVSSSNSAAVNRGIINDIANWIKDNDNTYSTPPCSSTLPVEITTFEGNLSANKVFLNWVTATEVNNYGFNVELRIENGEPALSEVEEWETIGFVQGNGTTNSSKQYSFSDPLDLTLNLNQVSYRLKQIDNDGTFTYSKIVTVDLSNITSVDDEVKYEFALEQNYPNPFNPTTSIKFTIPPSPLRPSPYQGEGAREGFVLLRVYDILGREVATLVNETKPAGFYEVQFDASSLSSGMYVYKLTSGEFVQNKKMLLIK